MKMINLKMNLCFINESRGTLKSFTLFIAIKIIPKLEYKDKFETEIEKTLAVEVMFSRQRRIC